jgi:oxygen-independent coproporphyrinogen-3 oxidase
VVQESRLEQTERAREMLLMGLRLTEGIDAARFADRTGISLADAIDQDVLQQALGENYLAWQRNRLVALPAGRLRLDALLAALVR